MQAVIPQIEEDQIVLYAAVEGKDIEGVLKTEVSSIYFLKSGKLSIELYKPHSRLVQAAQLLNNPTKEYFFKVRLIRKISQRKLYRTCVRQN
jgi:hypothetical protein